MNKEYKLELDVLYDDRCISAIFSKGHHELQKFYNESMLALIHHYEIEPSDERIENLDNSKQVWAKKVGWFEDGERKGYELKESKEEKSGHGWFPVTIAYL